MKKKDDKDAIVDGAYDVLGIAMAAVYKDSVERFGIEGNLDVLRGMVAQTIQDNHPGCTDHQREGYEKVLLAAAKQLDMEVPAVL